MRPPPITADSIVTKLNAALRELFILYHLMETYLLTMATTHMLSARLSKTGSLGHLLMGGIRQVSIISDDVNAENYLRDNFSCIKM